MKVSPRANPMSTNSGNAQNRAEILGKRRRLESSDTDETGVCRPATSWQSDAQGDELESHYLRCAPLPAYDKITRSSLGDAMPRGAEQRGSGAPEVARERGGVRPPSVFFPTTT